MEKNHEKDVHFHIDHAPPEEVVNLLKVLSAEIPISTSEAATILQENYGFQMQKDRTYSFRRLLDLGLVQRSRTSRTYQYTLTELGARVQSVLITSRDLCMDMLHYLHYTGYESHPNRRKLLWSYRKCSKIVWNEKQAISRSQLASRVQSEIKSEFPQISMSAREGGRFSAGSVSGFITWLKHLVPTPIPKKGKKFIPRQVRRPELVLLSLQHIYRMRSVNYGDPLLLDGKLLDDLSGVFFLDSECARELLMNHAPFTSYVEIGDTRWGTKVILKKAFTLECI